MPLITRRDLEEAIAKCQGQKNPNANTCIKLAAYYTILDHTPVDEPMYNTGDPPTEFMKAVMNRNSSEVMSVIDDLMEELQDVNPRLYYTVMERLE